MIISGVEEVSHCLNTLLYAEIRGIYWNASDLIHNTPKGLNDFI